MRLAKIFNIYDKYYKKSIYYIYAMTVYHFEIILFLMLFPTITFNLNTFIPLVFSKGIEDFAFLNYQIGFNFNTIFYSSLILLADFAFLFIIKNEIHKQELKYGVKYWYALDKKRIFFIECIIFYLSLGNPYIRETLYFLSLNTIQIYVIYRIFIAKIDKWLDIKICHFIFTTGAYLSILMLPYTVIETLIRLWYFVNFKL